jgi:hypothetical protein
MLSVRIQKWPANWKKARPWPGAGIEGIDELF